MDVKMHRSRTKEAALDWQERVASAKQLYQQLAWRKSAGKRQKSTRQMERRQPERFTTSSPKDNIAHRRSCSHGVNTIFETNLTATGLSTKSREKTGRELQTEGPIQPTISSVLARQRSQQYRQAKLEHWALEQPRHVGRRACGQVTQPTSPPPQEPQLIKHTENPELFLAATGSHLSWHY